jgi:hypothetical protein
VEDLQRTDERTVRELEDRAEERGRLGRSNEDALWKRFRAARTVFDRHRRAYFSQLDSNNSAAKAAKEKLIAEAEALSTSTDWGFAAGEYRRLMDEWKASPRASRKDDDALWARFRAAQDVFFSSPPGCQRRDRPGIRCEPGGQGGAPEKPTHRSHQGHRGRQEGPAVHPRPLGRGRQGPARRHGPDRSRAAKVEDAVRHAEDENWKRSNPETKARTNSA